MCVRVCVCVRFVRVCMTAQLHVWLLRNVKKKKKSDLTPAGNFSSEAPKAQLSNRPGQDNCSCRFLIGCLSHILEADK